MSKVFIAGIAGFLGSHVAELFASHGWSVTGIDNLTKFELSRTGYNVEKARAYNVNFLKSIGAELIVGDIRNYGQLIKATKGSDYIINCAAQPAMTIALEKPTFDAENNIMGTLNVLEVARQLNIPVAICSTIHVHGNGDNWMFKDLVINEIEYSEEEQAGFYDHILTGEITPLHVSKYATELYARAFIESYGCKVFMARLTGMYGERQTGGEDHGWLANFAIKTVTEQPIKIFGTDKQVRDMLYVKDAARAFLEWFEHCQPSGVYNIGGGMPCKINLRQSLDLLSQITGKRQDINIAPERKGDLWYFVCNTDKAKKAFGWQFTKLPKDGLPKLVKWVEENKELFVE